MTGNHLDVVLTASGVAVAVITFLYGVYRYAKADAARANKERKQIRDDAYAEGRESRADEVALLTSQLGDARYARDQASRRADDFERRWMDLQSQRRDIRGDQ